MPPPGTGGHEAERLGDLPGFPGQSIANADDRFVNRDLVTAALGRLTREHREVLAEMYLRGSSVAQAAHALGLAPGTVKSRTYYALRALLLAIEELRGAE